MKAISRRETLALLSAPLIAPRARSAALGIFDPNFGSALDAAAAIAGGKMSSVELTKHIFTRIDKFQPKLNAFVYQTREDALARAQRVDEAVARKEKLGPFAGVPVVVKESFAI